MRRCDAIAVFALALSLALLFVGLERVPALSMDEAWIADFAGRLRIYGAYTVHQMNRYTGPMFAWCVAAAFARLGVLISSLRLTGAFCNALALIALWAHLRRRVSAEAGAWWAVLAAGSVYFLMKSRLAWEVYALQPLLVTAVLVVLARARRPGCAAALAALCWVGVQNHFIFLSVPASLVVLFAARAAWRGEAVLPDLRASASALASGVVLAVLKYPISDRLWTAHPFLVGGVLLAAPAAAAAAVLLVAPSSWERMLAFVARPVVRRSSQWLLGASVLAFAVWHIPPLIQILAGPVVFKRLFSWAPPMGLSLLWHAWALFLLAVLAWQAVRAWHDGRLDAHERTLLLWPAAFAVIFIAFRHTSSLRYYSLPVWISLVSLAAALPRLAAADKRAVGLCAAAAVLATQAALWREIAAPADRRPLEFKIGFRHEDSWDFARKDALLSAFDATNACVVANDIPSMIVGPIKFHRKVVNTPCDQTIAFSVYRRAQAEVPPFFSWSVAPLARP